MDYGVLLHQFENKLKHTNMNSPINSGNFLQYLVTLFQELKQHGLTKKTLTANLVDQILKIFENNDFMEIYRRKYRNYLIYYITHLSNTMLVPTIGEKNEEKEIVNSVIEEGCETPKDQIINLKPEDFKDMEYDEEFEKILGIKKD